MICQSLISRLCIPRGLWHSVINVKSKQNWYIKKSYVTSHIIHAWRTSCAHFMNNFGNGSSTLHNPQWNNHFQRIPSDNCNWSSQNCCYKFHHSCKDSLSTDLQTIQSSIVDYAPLCKSVSDGHEKKERSNRIEQKEDKRTNQRLDQRNEWMRINEWISEWINEWASE